MNGNGPFHEGEKALQERAGVREDIERMGSRMIRDFMPTQHREFLARLPWLLVGSLDETGQPWASVLAGPPGFVATSDERTIEITAKVLSGAPLAAHLVPGRRVGLLGLEPHTRRRNRANGRVASVGAEGFSVHVEQSFGNCPKYIQARLLRFEPPVLDEPSPPTVALTASLSEAARDLLRSADTLFLATAHARAAARDEGSPARGVDISHRGGRPGFVRVGEGPAGGVRLTLPDFAGNSMFNSFGNLLTEPRAGLLAVDFATGDVLSLIGKAGVRWDGPDQEAFVGAERVLDLEVTRGVWLPRALPLRGSNAKLAPELEGLGDWES